MVYKQSKSALIRPYLYKNDYNIISISTLNGLIDAAISPLFNIKDEINIVYRIIDQVRRQNFINKYIQRLEFQNVRSFEINDDDCGETQFLIISTNQYSFCILFDFSLAENSKDTVFSSFFNSKDTIDILKILLPDEKFPLERRENIGLNTAILNLVKFCANCNQELDINNAEKNNLENITQTLLFNEFLAKQSRYISHEIKNHLSIIDIYTKIIEKTNTKNERINNATTQIYKSIANITKLLQGMKTFAEAELNVYNLNEIIIEVINSTQEMCSSKNIEIKTSLKETYNVILDKDKFQNVILNLIKNAIEALSETNKETKYINVSTEIKNEKISLQIKNNGEKIKSDIQTLIFEEGFTTKQTGSGLGLYICRQNLKEQLCDLSLLKSDDQETVFEILMNKI